MKSKHSSTEKELAERQQLDKALAESRSDAPEAGGAPNGTRMPRLVRAVQDRRDRSGLGLYDEYVQTAKDEPPAKPRRPSFDELRPGSSGPEGSRRWNSAKRSSEGLEEPVNGYAARGGGGRRPAPHGPQPAERSYVPAVLSTDDSVFTLLLDQVKELRQQKGELHGIIAEQEEKIFELIGLVHQLKSQPDAILERSTSPQQCVKDDDR